MLQPAHDRSCQRSHFYFMTLSHHLTVNSYCFWQNRLTRGATIQRIVELRNPYKKEKLHLYAKIIQYKIYKVAKLIKKKKNSTTQETKWPQKRNINAYFLCD